MIRLIVLEPKAFHPPLRQSIAISRRDRSQGPEILGVFEHGNRAEVIAEANERLVVAQRVRPPFHHVREPGIGAIHLDATPRFNRAEKVREFADVRRRVREALLEAILLKEVTIALHLKIHPPYHVFDKSRGAHDLVADRDPRHQHKGHLVDRVAQEEGVRLNLAAVVERLTILQRA